MLAKDVDACVEVIATHPVIGHRYGTAIERLGAAWLRLLGRDGMRTKVFEAKEHGRPVVESGRGPICRRDSGGPREDFCRTAHRRNDESVGARAAWVVGG